MRIHFRSDYWSHSTPFHKYLRFFFCITILFFNWANWLKEGAPFLEEAMSGKVFSGGLAPNLFHFFI
jgi:hypothetical protein